MDKADEKPSLVLLCMLDLIAVPAGNALDHGCSISMITHVEIMQISMRPLSTCPEH